MVGSGPHVWVPSEEDDLRGGEQEACALGWLKLFAPGADERFMMRAHDALSLEASQGGDSD